MTVRARIIASGRVQKVGFRQFVDRMAFDLNIRGQVRNLEDRSAEIICEAERALIDEFCNLISVRRYPIRVDDIKVTYSEPEGGFTDFAIIRDARSDGDPSVKLDLGMHYMWTMQSDLANRQDVTNVSIKEMHTDLAGRQEATNVAINEMHTDLAGRQEATNESIRHMHSDLSSKQDQTIDAVKAMDVHTGEHFEHLDEKYERFGEDLKEVSNDIKRIKELAEEAAGDRTDKRDAGA